MRFQSTRLSYGRSPSMFELVLLRIRGILTQPGIVSLRMASNRILQTNPRSQFRSFQYAICESYPAHPDYKYTQSLLGMTPMLCLFFLGTGRRRFLQAALNKRAKAS